MLVVGGRLVAWPVVAKYPTKMKHELFKIVLIAITIVVAVAPTDLVLGPASRSDNKQWHKFDSVASRCWVSNRNLV